MSTSTVRPPSATHGATAIAGLAAFIAAVVVLRVFRPFGDQIVYSAMFVMGISAGAIFLVDALWQKVYLRASTGVDFAYDDPSWNRTLHKCAGLLGSLAFIAFLYWLFPEYHGSFYDRYYLLLRNILLPWLALALPYVFFVDRRMRNPYDGYWHMGKLVTFQWATLDRNIIGQHLLGWLIKGFFLPLMFTYMCSDLARLLAYDFGQLTAFKNWFDFLYDQLYFIDVGLVAMGYLMSLRITDTHFRSAEPTMLGWAVALFCYEPFWSLFGRQYVSYETGYAWGAWLWDTPVIYGIWGTLILILTAIYVWATVIFGARFSNLTNRGIITNGPYRWTKHPAYVAKCLSWWLLSVPFVAQTTPQEALRHCLLLGVLNFIYLLRARTEERHLSRDPDYVAYALWMEERSLFRFVRRVPVLRQLAFTEPAKAAGGGSSAGASRTRR